LRELGDGLANCLANLDRILPLSLLSSAIFWQKKGPGAVRCGLSLRNISTYTNADMRCTGDRAGMARAEDIERNCVRARPNPRATRFQLAGQ
jgi:hypothetical protein